jgi:ribosomal protein L29
MKLLDLKKKSKEELKTLLREKKKELFNLSSASLAGEDSMKKKGRVSGVKKDIARIETLLRQ